MKYCRLPSLVVVVSALLCSPSPASAQYFGGFGPFMGGYGGYGLGGYGLGGYGFGGYGVGGYGVGGYGFNSPYGAMSGLPYYGSRWGYSTPYFANGLDRVTPIITPGFGASAPLRIRAHLYPAIAEPNREVIAAALEGMDKDRARIEIHVPAAAAKVSFDGTLMKQTGPARVYVTPRLDPANKYEFNIVVDWQDDLGRTHTIRRPLRLQAGDNATMDLRDPD